MNLKLHNTQVYILFVLSSFVLLFGSGIAPLFLEEPRRALMAMEMIFSGDYIHTTIHGAPYYNKPPMFNWLIAVGFRMFGYHEWVSRFVSVSAHLCTGYLVYRTGKKYLSNEGGLLSAGLYLVGVDILLYFSFLGEIDLFFSFLIVAGWLAFFHFTESKKNWVGYMLFYFFMALGFLTKGLPAIVFMAFTLLAWLVWNRNLKDLFSIYNFTGFGLFLGIIGLYLYPFIAKGDVETLLATLWSQSLERTTDEANIFKRIFSLFTFPFLFVKDIIPAAFLLIIFNKKVLKFGIASNRLIAFCVVVSIGNIWVYWISPETSSRYLYMFHPLLILPLTWIYVDRIANERLMVLVNKVFSFLPFLFIFLLLAGMFLVPIFLQTAGVSWALNAGFLGALIILIVARGQKWSPVFLTVLVLLAVRFTYGYITVSERSQNSQAAKDKIAAIEIANIVQKQPLFLLDSTRISYTISFYLQKNLGRVVPFKNAIESGDHLILPDSLLQAGMQVKKSFYYKGSSFSMVQVP